MQGCTKRIAKRGESDHSFELNMKSCSDDRENNAPKEGIRFQSLLGDDGKSTTATKEVGQPLSFLKTGDNDNRKQQAPNDTSAIVNNTTKLFSVAQKRKRDTESYRVLETIETPDSRRPRLFGGDDKNKDPDHSAKNNETDDINVDKEDCKSGDSSNSLDPTNPIYEGWEEKFQLLVEYKKKHKTTRVPYSDPTLGKWVHNQQLSFIEEKLHEYYMQRLYSIGFVWQIQTRMPWIEMYNQLQSYKEQHNGSTDVSHYSTEHRKLGRWVKEQRYAYSRGKLSNERSTLLESLRFQWRVVNRIPWMEMYQRLKVYNTKFGHTRVPKKWKEDPQLATWVNTQRQQCKKKDRIDLLNDIEFEWHVVNDWKVMYRRLLDYKERQGNTCVPRGYMLDPKLGSWVHTQRKLCKDKDRVDLLNAIGFEWNVRKDWGAMYQCLLDYKNKYGATNVPQNFKADPKLGVWVKRQRQHCTQKDRVDLLNKIGFDWKSGRLNEKKHNA